MFFLCSRLSCFFSSLSNLKQCNAESLKNVRRIFFDPHLLPTNLPVCCLSLSKHGDHGFRLLLVWVPQLHHVPPLFTSDFMLLRSPVSAQTKPSMSTIHGEKKPCGWEIPRSFKERPHFILKVKVLPGVQNCDFY